MSPTGSPRSDADMDTVSGNTQHERAADMIFEGCKVMDRRTVARRAHEYMRDVLGEEDIPDISDAGVLRDIYDCGPCVMHVAQVYLKGVMAPVAEREFGMRGQVTSGELDEIARRVLDPRSRLIRENCHAAQAPAGHRLIGTDEIMRLAHPLVIDVRSRHIYEESIRRGQGAGSREALSEGQTLPGTVNIPLAEYVLNPHLAGDDLFRNIVFVCESGQSASVAAEYASRAGYRSVFFGALCEAEHGPEC